MKVIFGRNNLPFSWIIRLFTWSRWSHCGIIIGTHVIEATAKEGVVMTPIPEFKRRYKTWAIHEVPVASGVDYEKLAYLELGKSYDWLAVFSIATRRDWDSSSKWFCSELIAHCSGIFRKDRISRITPEDIYKVAT